MKLSIAKFAVCALALSAWSCSDDLTPDGRQTNTTIEAEIADASAGDDSRTAVDPGTYQGNDVGILWTPTDSVGVFGDRGTANALFLNDDRGGNRKNTTFSGSLAQGEMALNAYYPYSAKAGTDIEALCGSLPGVQQFSMATGEISGDYKYGVVKGGGSANVKFGFRHIFSLMRVAIDASDTEIAGQRLESIRFSIVGRQTHGDFTFSATTGKYQFTDPDPSRNTIEMQWTDRPALVQGRAYVGYVTVAPTAEVGDRILVSVLTEECQADFEMQAVTELVAGGVYTLPLKLALKAGSWTVSKRERPEITAMSFTSAANPGKILDREVYWGGKATSARTTDGIVNLEKQAGDNLYAYIPYLHSRSLVPTFTVPEGVTVYHGQTPVVSGETVCDFAADPTLRAVAASGADRVYTVKLENTGLPVVVVNQSKSGDFSEKKVDGFLGIGAVTTNKFVDFWVRGKDTEWVEDDKVTIYNADGSVDLNEALAGVRLRGNSTQKLDKKPFAIKFTAKQSVLGMPAHKRWCLLANRLDRSLIRNNVAFRIAHITDEANPEGLGWNPHGRNVELIIDGRYVGNYYLCEQIKIDASRVAINKEYDAAKPKNFEECGYLIELDTQYDEVSKFETSKRKIPVMLKDEVPADYLAKIQTQFNAVESNLVAGNYAAAYEQLDINSVIDQTLVFELTMNDEYKHPKSVYYTINPAGGKTPGDGKIHASAVWDFDWATFPNIDQRKALGDRKYNETSYTAWGYVKDGESGDNFRKLTYVWTPLLVKDATFKARIQERWAALYPRLAAEVPAYIRSLGAENERSFAINDAIWPAGKAASSANSHYNGDEGFATYSEVIESMVTAFNRRLEWMNTAITNGNI